MSEPVCLCAGPYPPAHSSASQHLRTLRRPVQGSPTQQTQQRRPRGPLVTTCSHPLLRPLRLHHPRRAKGWGSGLCLVGKNANQCACSRVPGCNQLQARILPPLSLCSLFRGMHGAQKTCIPRNPRYGRENTLVRKAVPTMKGNIGTLCFRPSLRNPTKSEPHATTMLNSASSAG